MRCRRCRDAIRQELGRVFRSDGFNFADASRSAAAARHSFIPYRELYEMRQRQAQVRSDRCCAGWMLIRSRGGAVPPHGDVRGVAWHDSPARRGRAQIGAALSGTRSDVTPLHGVHFALDGTGQSPIIACAFEKPQVLTAFSISVRMAISTGIHRRDPSSDHEHTYVCSRHHYRSRHRRRHRGRSLPANRRGGFTRHAR